MSHFQLHEVYKPHESSKIIQSSTCLHLDNTSPRLVSTCTSTAAPGCYMPSRPLLFLYRLARVHQEDRSSSLARSRPLLKNVLTNAPSVSSQHFGCHRHLPRNILVAIVIYIATFSLPKSFDIQDVLSKCTPKNVLSKCTVKLVLQVSSLLTSSHSGQACHCGAVSRLWCSFPARVSLILPTCHTSCYCWTPTVGWVCSWRSVSL